MPTEVPPNFMTIVGRIAAAEGDEGSLMLMLACWLRLVAVPGFERTAGGDFERAGRWRWIEPVDEWKEVEARRGAG